jgi:hypothetical protein
MLKCSSQVAAVVRIFGLVALAVGLTVSAQQREAQPAQPVTQIKVVPEKPTPNDEIKIELSGTFPNSCAPEAESVKVAVEFNQVTINLANASEFCLDAESKWSLSVPVGKKLDAGPYRVLVLYRMTQEPPDLLLGMERFDVVASGALGDQVGRQADPIVPFTILPLDQGRGDGTWSPGPLFASNLNSSKSNLNRQVQLSLPATVGLPKGDVVTLGTINTTKLNTFRVVGCTTNGDAKIIDNCIPPFGPDKPTKIEITGENPIFTFLLEQTELPDLTVRINTLVRRYTEREQVFCDITVLTRVQNLGKGPAGVVALANNLNSSKANLLRWGMDSGAEATQVAILIRLRPGSYLLEAEVQSLSLKESNDKNNKVTQVVTCR